MLWLELRAGPPAVGESYIRRSKRRHCEEDGKQASKKRAFFAAEELVFALDGEEEECNDEDEEQAPPAKLQDRRAIAEGVDIKAWCQRGTADFCPPHTWCQSLPAHAPSLEAAFLPVLLISLLLSCSCEECLFGCSHRLLVYLPHAVQ